MNTFKNIWAIVLCLTGAISSAGMDVEFIAKFKSEEEDSSIDIDNAFYDTETDDDDAVRHEENSLAYSPGARLKMFAYPSDDEFQIDLSKYVDFSKINTSNDNENRGGELIHDPAISAMSDMEYQELAFEDFKKSVCFSSDDKAAKECIEQWLNESRPKKYGRKSSRIRENSMYKLGKRYLKMGDKENGDFCIEEAAELGNDKAIKKLEKLITLRKLEIEKILNNKRPAKEKPLLEEPQKKRKRVTANEKKSGKRNNKIARKGLAS